MKKEKILYWVATVPICALMVMSGVMYLSKSPQVMQGIQAIGMPYFFIQFLGVAKLLGALALAYPRFKKVTEWAYAGFTFTFLGAMWTHYSTGTSFVMPLGVLVVLGISYKFKDEARG